MIYEIGHAVEVRWRPRFGRQRWRHGRYGEILSLAGSVASHDDIVQVRMERSRELCWFIEKDIRREVPQPS